MRGMMHNGPHVLDMARYLFGEMTDVSAHGAVDDFGPGDLTIGGFAAFERCPNFYLAPGDGRQFAIFEFDILMERKRLRFIEEGLSLVAQDIVADPIFKGYSIPGEAQVRKTGLDRSMQTLYEHAICVLEGRESSRSSLESALNTQEACLRFTNAYKNNQTI